MQADAHIGENAELYALGALSESEHAAVDAHIADCAECLRRVGEAEETVLALEREAVAEPQAAQPANVLPLRRRGVSVWWIPAAAAAALILGLLVPRMPAQQQQQSPPLLAMIHSHFSHAQFSGPAGAPAAKVIYARDRSWYYVIVEGSHRYEVDGVHAQQRTNLGTTQPVGATSELFVRMTQRFETLELREGGTVAEKASIR